MTSQAYALARAELVRVLTVHTGITTDNGAVGGTSLRDRLLIGSNDFITGKTILILTGNAAYEDCGALSFVPGTGVITLQGAGVSAQILAGTIYKVLNISSVEVDVATIITNLGDPSGHTLTSITTKFGNIARSLDLIFGARWDAAGDLGTDIAAIIAAIAGITGYAELSATGTTTDAYVTALDIDARLYNEFTIKINNTHGANALDYRVLLRPENGVAEQMIQPEDISIAFGDYDFVNIDHKWGQVIVQVRATVGGNQATYSIYVIANKQ